MFRGGAVFRGVVVGGEVLEDVGYVLLTFWLEFSWRGGNVTVYVGRVGVVVWRFVVVVWRFVVVVWRFVVVVWSFGSVGGFGVVRDRFGVTE